MLKSVSTQFAATLFFGPLGLAYSSVAAAVFLTLVLAVLYFSELGVLAVLAIWPLSIIVGLIFVKLHNDGVQSSGSRLLLGPGEEAGLVSALGSWARGVAVLALIVTAGYLFYLYLPQNGSNSNNLGRIVDSGVGIGEPAETLAVPLTDTTTSTVIAANSKTNGDNFAMVTLPEREVTTVVLSDTGVVTTGESQIVSSNPQLIVNSEVVNLRQGPGTNFPIVVQLDAGDRLFEFARDGSWINVETESSGYTGWIFESLVR